MNISNQDFHFGTLGGQNYTPEELSVLSFFILATPDPRAFRKRLKCGYVNLPRATPMPLAQGNDISFAGRPARGNRRRASFR
jgi:hypothetical protein